MSHLQLFAKNGEIMALANYGNLMLPGSFSDKIILDIDFTDVGVVQLDIPVVKTLL